MEISVDSQLLDLTAITVNHEFSGFVQSERAKYETNFRRHGNFNNDETLGMYIERHKWEYFNNLHTNFPDGYVRRIIRPASLDVKCRLLADKRDLVSGLFSDLYLDHTPRQFFETIDQVLGIYNIPAEQINELRNESNWASLYALTLPVYVHLRALSYNHRELTM